jgi:hypothetical protein
MTGLEIESAGVDDEERKVSCRPGAEGAELLVADEEDFERDCVVVLEVLLG